MTPEQTRILKGMISEYGNSLTRIRAEKELLKFIEQRAFVECQQDQKAFKAYATAYWRDEIKKSREVLETQLALFEDMQDFQVGDVIQLSRVKS